MAKRYHQSKKDRMHEHRGMERHERGPVRGSSHSMSDDGGMIWDRRREAFDGNGSYSGLEARRHQEMIDAGMIEEDRNAIANLPQQVMMKPYPKTGPYMPEGLDDTISGVDRQMSLDDSQRRKNFLPKKF